MQKRLLQILFIGCFPLYSMNEAILPLEAKERLATIDVAHITHITQLRPEPERIGYMALLNNSWDTVWVRKHKEKIICMRLIDGTRGFVALDKKYFFLIKEKFEKENPIK